MADSHFYVHSDCDFGGAEQLGRLYAGPGALGFLDWIANEAQEDAIDHLLFLSPNTSIPELLSTQAFLPARCSCLQGSLSSFMLAAIDEGNFLEHLEYFMAESEGMTPAALLKRIGVTPPASFVLDDLELGADAIIDTKNKRRVAGLLRAMRADILRICYRTKRGLLRHLVELGVRPDMRVALVDIGWNGAVQAVFEHAVRQLLDLDVFGYYFCLDETPDCRLRRTHRKMKSLIGTNTIEPDLLEHFIANRSVAEFLFSAPDGPTIVYSGWPVDSVPILRGAEHFAASHTDPRTPIDMARPMIEFVANAQLRR